MNRNKLLYFKIGALLVPVILLCLLELFLRLCGYGYQTSLFVPDPDDAGSMVMSRSASYKFFSDTTNATKGNRERFKRIKTPQTFRIFVLGESTTAGYPYYHNGSFHRWLQYRLIHTFPDRNFEVINVSLTAVNSYTVLDFGRQLLPYQPDAVLIYTGHNEYYGALGIGSTSRIAGNRFWIQTMLKLRSIKLVQLMENGIRHLQQSGSSERIDTRDNLMKRMAASQEIEYGSEDYQQGISQFEQNITEVCQLFSEKHIPVFLSNIISNEKDLPPFISKAGKYDAGAAFASAQTAYAKGDLKLAKKIYQQAKEYDLLRFRAPEAINQSIQKIAGKYPGVYLTDSQKLFEAHSAGGIPGRETLLEHVHPNLFGYALLSEAFYQEMKHSGLIKPLAADEMSFAALRKRMPVTTVDSLYGAWQIMMLKTGWPFNVPLSKSFKRGNSEIEKITGGYVVGRMSWMNAMDRLFKYSMKVGDRGTALKVTEAVLLENPWNMSYDIYAGRLSFELGDHKSAELYFKKAYLLDPSKPNLENLYLLCLKTDQPQRALFYLNQLREYRESVQAMDRAKLQIEAIIQMQKQGDTLSASSRAQISLKYHQLNANEAAAKYQLH